MSDLVTKVPDERALGLAKLHTKSLALFVVGFSAAAKIKRGAAAGVIVTLWLVVVAFGVVWNLIF